MDGSIDAQRCAKTIIFRVNCRIRVVGMWVVTVAFFQALWLNIFIIKCWRKTKKMQNRVLEYICSTFFLELVSRKYLKILLKSIRKRQQHLR